MPKVTPQQKGKALERAVKFIQQTILNSNPSIRGVRFSIESNQIIVVGGVRHEIDVLVKTLPGSAYEAIWIFECKNWQKKAGKNEVALLADKIAALKAVKGFLVAKQFTRDAENRAKQDDRIRLIPCSENISGPLADLNIFHVCHNVSNVEVFMKDRNKAAVANPPLLDWKIVNFTLNGVSIDFAGFVGARVDEVVLNDRKNNAAKHRLEGVHHETVLVEQFFGPGEFRAGAMDVEKILMKVHFTVSVIRKNVTSTFELKNQGRVISIEAIEDSKSGSKFEIDLVQLL
jgi:hypothetical protein